MKVLILMNAYPNGEKFYRQSNRIKTELEKLGVEIDVLLNGEVSARLTEDGKVKTALYDLSGRRVQKGQKGVFIQNGKVMVR